MKPRGYIPGDGVAYKAPEGTSPHTTLLGVELEVEAPTEPNKAYRRHAADKWLEDNYEDWLHVCPDGSLKNGLELVTRPFKLATHRTMWKRILEYLQGQEFETDPPTGGLHVHFEMPRLPEDGKGAMAWLTINKAPLQAIAGRKNERWAAFGYGEAEGHMRVLNLTSFIPIHNPAMCPYGSLKNRVYEWRAGQSTLSYPKLMARLGLAAALSKFLPTLPEDAHTFPPSKLPPWGAFKTLVAARPIYYRELLAEMERLGV